MKKILTFILCAALFLCLSACENGSSDGGQTNTTASQKHEQNKLVLVDSGWSVSKQPNNTFLFYAVKIENPNETYAVEFPIIRITAKDGEGKILKSEEQYLRVIAAGDTITYGNYIMYDGEAASSVEMNIVSEEYNYKKQDDALYAKSSSLAINNISENKSKISAEYTGEITNKNDAAFDQIAVSVVYKAGGKMIGGAAGYISSPGAGETIPFEISGASHIGNYDSFELHAIQW